MIADFPESKVLSGWRQQMIGLRPQGLWVGSLVIHRLEATVRCVRAGRLEAFLQRVLQAFDADIPHTLDALERRLGIQRQILHQILRVLGQEGLIEPAWKLTDLGRVAQQRADYPRVTRERRVFHFRHMPGGEAWFLPLADSFHGQLLREGNELPFSLEDMDRCLRQSDEWKQQHGFPSDVERLERCSQDATEAEAWQCAPLDLVMSLPLVVALETDRLTAFSYRPTDWILDANDPILDMKCTPEALPEIIEEDRPAIEQDLGDWKKRHGLSEGAFRWEILDQRLRVYLPVAEAENMRAKARDEWLLVGQGTLRRALQLEIVIAE